MDSDASPSPTLPAPHPRSYWVLPGRFAAGCYPGDLHPEHALAKRTALLDAGITDFVSLMEADETDYRGDPFHDYWPSLEEEARQRAHPVAFHRFPIVDQRAPTLGQMRATLAVLDALLAHQRTVYLHCWGGRGRTGTVLSAWFILHQRLTPTEAVAYLHALIGPALHRFEPTPESPIQYQFLEQWAKDARA